jgi:hypothetical protein
MATVTIIQPDGTTTLTERDPSDRPSLKELQKAVGGYIEPVDAMLDDGTVAYANEEGLLMGMPPNPKATREVKWPYPIVGPVVILRGFDDEE